MRPDEGERTDFLGRAAILLLQTVGAEEDKDHDAIVSKEGEEAVGGVFRRGVIGSSGASRRAILGM